MNLKNILLGLNYKGPKWNVFQFFLATCLICMLMVTMSSYNFSSVRIILPTRVPLDHPKSPYEMQGSNRTSKLQGLATSLIADIERLSNPSSCENVSTLYCGYGKGCGFGCQLHHVAACLMLSYSIRTPLIHDTREWPYGKWLNTFQPLGSSCPVNERTIIVRWDKKHVPVLSLNKPHGQAFPYPFQSGIPVDEDFFRAINESHPKPFLWFVGQFLKYVIRLSPIAEPIVEEFLGQAPWNSPIVGLQIRRTDKVSSHTNYFHDFREYMLPADAYFRRVNCNLNRTVYLASDDNKLLSQAKHLYPPPKWRLIGLDMNVTFPDQKSRHNSQALMYIIKDVLALSKCHYVVCGFSSNICRLVLELISADDADGPERVTNLDVPYVYQIRGHMIPTTLIPVRVETRE